MHLRQPKPLRMLDHHHRRIRHIHAHFNHRRRNQHIDLAALKPPHRHFFLIRISRPCSKPNAQPGQLRARSRSYISVADLSGSFGNSSSALRPCPCLFRSQPSSALLVRHSAAAAEGSAVDFRSSHPAQSPAPADRPSPPQSPDTPYTPAAPSPPASAQNPKHPPPAHPSSAASQSASAPAAAHRSHSHPDRHTSVSASVRGIGVAVITSTSGSRAIASSSAGTAAARQTDAAHRQSPAPDSQSPPSLRSAHASQSPGPSRRERSCRRASRFRSSSSDPVSSVTR